MSNAIYHLSRLSFEQIEWITELKNKICQNGEITDEDIEIAFGKITSQDTTEDMLHLTVSSVSPDNAKTLYRLYENLNIEGLYDGKEIVFSPELTVIYGKNGSGKTSFFKALKDAFQKTQNIKGNIYSPSTNTTSAKFDFVDKEKHLAFQKKGLSTNFPGSELQTYNWTTGNQINASMKFCDRKILNSSLSKKDTGWSVDRYKLGHYDILRNAVDKVGLKVTTKIAEISRDYNSRLQTLLNGLKSEKDDGFKKQIQNNLTNHQTLKNLYTSLSTLELTDDHQSKKEGLQKNSTVSVSDLTTKIEALKAQGTILTNIQNITSEKTHIFSELIVIKEKIKRVTLLKNSLDFSKLEQYHLLFNSEENRDNYIELIKKITETALVFGHQNYPQSVEKCFYCNQNLPEENKLLISEIHSLIDNEISKEINGLNVELKSFRERIQIAVDKETPDYNYTSVGGIYDLVSKKQVQLDSLHTNAFDCSILSAIDKEIEELKDTLNSFDLLWNYNELLFYVAQSENNIVSGKIKSFEKQLLEIEKSKKTALDALNTIEDYEFCCNQKELISTLSGLLSENQKYTEANNHFAGYRTKISRDKGRVENELIRQNYLVTFNDNLEYFELPKRDCINRPFSNPSGQSKVDAKIQGTDHQFEISDVLSEGEAKIYAFCDWLTELEFDDNKILVLDDPVTSLDQSNIYKVVEKIIELSKNYQVIVFTHHFEFYHRLIQKSLGGKPINKGKCELCAEKPESNQCIGYNVGTGNTHKCSSYYLIEHILKPGQIIEDVMFFTLGWEQRIEVLRQNLLAGNIREADKHLRTSINNFFERFVLNDVKRQVYKNNDLIKEWRSFRQLDINDYNTLMEVHNKVSGESTIHEPSEEVRTPLDVRGYIGEFNKSVRAINNIRSFDNPSPPNPIGEIII
ncbi:AAA family ATPase [Flagellimonas hymeniacidonis]|uniref:AAA family ATPase n=1 Tax=Flagellimonas hymeniacidonis TaxID=2603628 RepID=A0A5C8V0R0_9FLAO|nr:AAA family ATPase [Flagellimonas hymeniacidonis]TXN34991.1 AAA family ATPase [Flagellimonas hymeniacidonis]